MIRLPGGRHQPDLMAKQGLSIKSHWTWLSPRLSRFFVAPKPLWIREWAWAPQNDEFGELGGSAVKFSDRDVATLRDLVTAASAAGQTTLVAIDGLGGAGKSTLSAQLRDSLDASSSGVEDDFYRPVPQTLAPEQAYEAYFDWQRLRDTVLKPLSRSSPARYRRHDWVTDAPAEWHEVPPGGVVIVEGVYSTRPELRSFFGVTVFVETPREQRLARMLDRRYEDVAWVGQWMAAEDWYLEHMRPLDHVDLVVDGSSKD